MNNIKKYILNFEKEINKNNYKTAEIILLDLINEIICNNDKQIKDKITIIDDTISKNNINDNINEFDNNPINFILNNQIIQFREIDNYINATQLCKAGGKKFNDWLRFDTTKKLINVFASNRQLQL